ncbi:MAG: NCS2 family permease [Gloeocapsa sp. UFS-A4-WI-NPMV-4B04]|jgi:AGZA family xanthine/uracil permease-like MFS transporter|nr:NCS2 family permease [Gloeocapsa sp. UFS-A4-WI-NPMV-4B04]
MSKKSELTNNSKLPNHQSSSPELQPASLEGRIARFFKFEQNQTNLRQEMLAGVTTFMAMAYILAVNPSILSNAIFLQQPKDLFGQLAIATALSATIATSIMGLVANYPFALAPAMGLNAYFTFSVVLGLGISWRVALTAVFVEGLIILVLTLSNIRNQIIMAIPECLKRATATGIGLFIAYIGLSGNPATGGAGLIVANETTKTALGAFNNPATLMASFGIFVTAALVARRLKGALLYGILATALLGWILGIAPWPKAIVALPPWPGDLLGQAIFGLAQVSQTNIGDFLSILVVFLFVDIFDTIGTLTGLGMQAGYINEKGTLPRAGRALMADAVGIPVGAALGTSTVSTYIESAAGIAEGGRTGFTSVVVAALFAMSIFFIPLLAAIPGFATAPALVIVGVLMAESLGGIRWSDPAESIPSFLTILMMPLTYSIAEGLAIGFITYPLLKTFQGKSHELTLPMWLLAGVFVLRFVQLGLQAGH